MEDIRDAGVTVLLVTSFIEEAERLWGRVIVIDNADGAGGRVIAAGTPAELAGSTSETQVITFVPSGPLDLTALHALPSVGSAEQNGRRVTVSGPDAAITDVVAALARLVVVARELRVQQPNLDDAFVRMTDHTAAGAGSTSTATLDVCDDGAGFVVGGAPSSGVRADGGSGMAWMWMRGARVGGVRA